MDAQQSLTAAQKYTEDLLSFFDLNVETTATLNDDVIEIAVPSSALNSLLIGRNADTLRALQFLVASVLRNNDAAISRVNLDIAEYKKQHAEKVAEKARGWIEEVRTTGDSYVASINAADRRVVHQVALEYDDIRTFSEGEGRERKIIIAQKSS